MLNSTTIKNFIMFVFNVLKSVIGFIFFFLRIERFFFFFKKFFKKEYPSENLRLVEFDAKKKKTLLNTDVNSILFWGEQKLVQLNKLPKIQYQKKNFVFNFNTNLLNNLIFDLESFENSHSLNVYDFFDEIYNQLHFVKSTLFNYSLFQSRLITNESALFDQFFYNLSKKVVKQHELGFYQFFVFNYNIFYIQGDYNLQVIHSRDNMSFNNFFASSYYDFFQIQQEFNFFFNKINILDDFRSFSTIIQLNNNLETNNIENYMINLQKLIFNEIDIFYNTKISYINYKYIFLFYYTLLTYNRESTINSSSLFEQPSLMFSMSAFNLFYLKLSRKLQLSYSIIYFFFFSLVFVGILICSLNSFVEVFFLIFLICAFLFLAMLSRFLILFDITLFGYSKKKLKLDLEKLYLSDYSITQYDDIFYYQQQYIIQRDSANRNTSSMLTELENFSNFEDVIDNPSNPNLFDSNLPELLFINFYEILYDFENDWKDNDLEDLERFELDRIEISHGYPLEEFFFDLTDNNITFDIELAANTEDLFDLYDTLTSIVDRAETPEGFYDLLTNHDLDEIEDYIDDLEEFFDTFRERDRELFEMFTLKNNLEITEKEQRRANAATDTNSILNYDIPDEISESVDEEFLDPENITVSHYENVFTTTTKKIQKKIFQTIYFELLDEKTYLIKKYNLFFLLTNKKYLDHDLGKLQNLLQTGCIPLWILNTNNFYKEVKTRHFNWYQQLLASKKIYSDFSLALLNLDTYYNDLLPHYYNQEETTYLLKNDILVYQSVVRALPGMFVRQDVDVYYDYEISLRQFYSSIFAYTDSLSGYFFTSNFVDDQNIVNVLEATEFSNVLNDPNKVPIQLDFFQNNRFVLTQMLNTLNSNLHLLFCNNVNLADSIFKNQLFIFQYYLEYTIVQIERQQNLSVQIKTFFDLVNLAKLNTIFDIELFFYTYLLKKTKIINLTANTQSHFILLNLVNYYIHKYSLYELKLPTNILELNKFLVKLAKYEIFIGGEVFDSNLFIENQELNYDRYYNFFFNVFDKEYLEYEELDSFFSTEFLENTELLTQFVYNNTINLDSLLYCEEEVLDGDLTKLPPYVSYTPFNNLTLVTEFTIPTINQKKYLFADYMYSTIYAEISDDMFDFDGFFL